MVPENLEVYVCLGILIAVAWADGKHHKIPNTLTVLLFISGLVSWWFLKGGLGVSYGVVAGVLGFSVSFIFYLFSWIGAGDVKLITALMTALGLWLGLTVLIISFFFGGVVVLFQVLHRKVKSIPLGCYCAIGYIITISCLFIEHFS